MHGLTLGEERRLRVFLSPEENMEQIIRNDLDRENMHYLEPKYDSFSIFYDNLIIPRRRFPIHSIVFQKYVTNGLDIPSMLKRIVEIIRFV